MFGNVVPLAFPDDEVSTSTDIYCTLIAPLCSISYNMANRPISSDIGWLDEQANRPFRIMGGVYDIQETSH